LKHLQTFHRRCPGPSPPPIFLFTIKGINTSIRSIGILVNNACLVFIAPNAVDQRFKPLHTLDITFKYELIKIKDSKSGYRKSAQKIFYIVCNGS